MGKTYTAFIKHTHIGKSSQAEPYTARAHSRYIQRRSETHVVRVHLMPDSYKARQRWWYDHENGLRKNGRVVDKLTFSIPHEISQTHAEKILFGFGLRLGQERCPFEFTLQGFESRNHHSHFMFVDRDYETGKRVFGTSERNSSHQIKLEWEHYANSQFEELGYDVRVKVHDGYELEATNDNQEALETPSVEASDVDNLQDIETSPEDALTGDEDMPAVTTATLGVDPAATVRFLHEQRTELNSLHHHQRRLQEAVDRHLWLVEQRELKAEEAGEYHTNSLPTLQEAYAADLRMKDHTTSRGRLKGFGLRVFGHDLFKTNARRQAEEAQSYAARMSAEAKKAEYTRRAYELELVKLGKQVSQAEQDAYARRAELERVYGKQEEMKQAETYLKNGIDDAVLLVSLSEAVHAYGEGEITTEEYRSFLIEGGYNAELQLLDEQLEQESGQSL